MTPASRKGTPVQRSKTSVPRKPFWRLDARARLRALLPELAVSIVTSTCLSAVIAFNESSDMAVLVAASFVAQLFVQPVLYVCTYLSDDTRATYGGWFVIMMLGYLPMMNARAQIYIFLAFGMGVMVFYLTRVRPLFIIFLLEMLVLGDGIGDLPELLFVHIVGVAAISALFVMRSSATRITLDYKSEDSFAGTVDAEGAKASRLSSLGPYGQVAALGVAVGALCLATVLLVPPVIWRRSGTSSVPSTTATGTSQEVSTGEPQALDDAPSSWSSPSSEPSFDASGAESTDSAREQTPREESIVSSDGEGHSTAPASRDSGTLIGTLAALLLLAALVLPVPLKLLVRWLARSSLVQEPSPANRAARIYLAIIDRLATVGIVRDETQTPSEFLDACGVTLSELMVPKGFESEEAALEAWIVLTDVYERARYGSIDPTEPELELCWRLYDALPACACEAVGWCRYLLGAFWNM